MKKSIISILYFGALILILGGIYKLGTAEAQNYKDLGGSKYASNLDTKVLLEKHNVTNIDSLLNKELLIVYAVDYAECANSVTEIKEFFHLFNLYQEETKTDIAQVLLVIDKDTERGRREARILNVDFLSGFGFDNELSTKLRSFDENTEVSKQILFIDRHNNIYYRNKISSNRIVPIDEKKQIIETGIAHAKNSTSYQ